MCLFDTHCHLDDERFNEDREEVIASFQSAGIDKCVCVGSDLPSSERCLALSRRYPFIYAACGVHPHEAEKAPENYLSVLEEMLKEKKAVALGEIGLDYYYDFSPRDTQKSVFSAQLDLACRLDKPVIMHIRDAHNEALELLRSRSQLPRGIVHCFSGSAEIMKEYVKMGFYISFAGPVTFKKAPRLQEAAALVPADRLLAETDSPYLAPEPVRGRRNDPRNVRYVVEKLAEIRHATFEETAALTEKNASVLYGI